MEQGKPQERVFGPLEVAKDLGVSSSGLRRLALIYERVYGQLPRDPRLGRMWTLEAIGRLEEARAEVQKGRAVSVEAALAALRAGMEPASPVVRGATIQEEPLAALLLEIKSLREAVEEQNRLLSEQGRRIGGLEEENRLLRESIVFEEQEDLTEQIPRNWMLDQTQSYNPEDYSASLEGEEPSKADPEDINQEKHRPPWWKRLFGR